MPDIPFSEIIAPLLFITAGYFVYRGFQGRDIVFRVRLHPWDETNKRLNRIFAVFWSVLLLVLVYLLFGGRFDDIGTNHFYAVLLKILGILAALALFRHFLTTRIKK